ncbi:Hpt domain-containing protein [Aromatoleum diolicum]|uniref:histidine kinase n=1 Tax=Aromatoleum diolicum TaxID=75796 RepID=A0ABX1Q6E0_9RHOO|nr:Hpt domain-containing protein [Aromatoleum diolicum]NMG73878.1 response regulator [Aromatoleum diolicum]
MTHIELDLGPLTWVKNEIDLALARADESLELALDASDATARIQFAQTHLHQVRGALSIVGLDGLTQFASSLDQSLGALARGERAPDATTLALARRALATIGNYLEELVHGTLDQPLRLLSLYREIHAIRSTDPVSPAELFFPDLSQRPPRRQIAVIELSEDARQNQLRMQRAQFQRGLLQWLRSPTDAAGPTAMLNAVKSIEALHTGTPVTNLWYAAQAFLETLLHGDLPVQPEVKRLCSQLDAQLKRLADVPATVPERLIRELLYWTSQAPARTVQQQAIRNTWHLDALIPEAGASVSATPLAPLLKSLQTAMAGAKQAWDEFSEGHAAALPHFASHLSDLAARAPLLGRPALDRLLDSLFEFIRWLRKDPLLCTDQVALEVATALLLADGALERGAPDSGFSAQVTDTVSRLGALMRGEEVGAAEHSQTVETARRMQEREALGQLSREILSSLAQVEQILDDYFRNQQKRAPLANLATPLKQIEGALTLLGDEQAIALVHDAAATVARFAQSDVAPEPGQFEALAQRLSALGFYVQALQHGPANLQRFLDPAAAARAIVEEEAPPITIELPQFAETPTAPPAPATAPASAAAPLTPAATAVAQAPEMPAEAVVEVSAERPRETIAAEPAEHTLEFVPLEAVLVATPETEAPSGDTRSAEAAKPAPEATPEILVAPAPMPAAPPAPPKPAEASAAEIDAELLEIFIEEAHEVLATIGEQLELSRTASDSHEHLIAIRRAFHTLKGSGRMVGLLELGEAAWGMEQTLNRWLQLEWPPSPALHHLIDAAYDTFSGWVHELEAGGSQARDVSELMAEAERLRSSETAIIEPAPLAPAAPSAPVLEQAAEAEAAGEAAETPFEVHALERAASGEILPFSGAERIDIEALPEELALDEEFPEEISLEDLEPVEAFAPEVAREETPQPIDLTADVDRAETLDEAPLSEMLGTAHEPAIEAGSEWLTDFELADEMPRQQELEPTAEIAAEAATALPAEEQAEAMPPEVAEPAAAEDLATLGERDVVRIGNIEVSRPLYDLYLGEARHHLAILHTELARLEINPTLVPAEVTLRAAHTLAGISGTTRVMSVQGLARALEHAIERLRDGAHPPTMEQAAVLKSSNDTLEAMLAQVAVRQMPLVVPELIEQLDSIGRTIPLDTDIDIEAEHMEGAGAADAFPAGAQAAEPAATPAVATPVQDDLDEQLLPIFLEEGNELVTELHATLRNWRSGAVAGDHAKAIARLLHTLKGSARMAGAMTLGEHVHQLESRFEAARSAEHEPAALIEDLISGLDHAEQLIAALTGTGAAVSTVAEETAGTAVAAVEAATAETESGSATATLRVRADTVDRFVNEAGEIGIARTRIAGELRTLRRSLLDLTENVIRLRNQLREVEIQADVQMQSRIAHTGTHEGEFDPLEMDRYTRLQELTRMMAESVGDVTTVQQSLLRNLDGAELALNSQARMSRDLQQALMQVRMVPFDSLADRLYRVTRQTAKDLGKRANLDLRGGRIEIDRSVLEHITAPLEHLLRNAFAHGIESPDVRKAVGKDEIGQITLSVSQEGNEIAISLTDDGAGLDYARIAERARASGLLGPDEVADERRLTNLIFLPGFSTASNVSTVSGRGVGMDVVKSETAAVGGRIDIRAAHGKGTEFRIYLPLTLAVTQALLVRAGGRSYAIPSSMIAQVQELKVDALHALREAGGTDWQDVHFNYRYLPRLLGDRVSLPEEQRFNWVLLLRAGAQTLALHVDALRGNQEIVVKNAGPQLARIVGISGATVLGDGEIVLILNPVALASRGLIAGETVARDTAVESLEPLETAQAEHQPTVMVVDDSLTVRKITGRLLEREGYRVITAKDGVDALERLIETVPDVILSDIEMPRMDGFDLLRNIRADERTRSVPVIMITSRLADKHRQFAEKMGANEYLGKPYEEGELLGLLRSYTAKAHVAA